jgi:hypothetical protein
MPKVPLYNMSGAQVGELELNDSVFGIEPNQAVLYDFIKMQLAKKRVGTASVKTRAMVRGGGRKPWRQKGTGRARVGSNRNPVWTAIHSGRSKLTELHSHHVFSNIDGHMATSIMNSYSMADHLRHNGGTTGPGFEYFFLSRFIHIFNSA